MEQKGGNFAVLFHLPNIRGEEVVNTMGELAYAYGEGNGWEFLAVDISQSGDHDFGFKLKALPALYFYHTYMGVTTKEAFPGEDMAANQVAAEMAKFQYKLLKKRLDETAYGDEDEEGKEDEGSKEGAGGGTEEQARPKSEFFGMTSVLEVDFANFESVMADKAPIILKLYAPWCGHCQSMKPNYIAAADRMKRSKFPVRFAAVDCDNDNNKPLCQQFGIKSFPTILYREAKAALSEFKPYEGERSEDALYEFAFGLAGELARARPVAELTGQKALQSECLGFGGHGTSTVCIIAFLPDIYEGGKSARNAHLAALKDLAKAEKASQDQGYLWSVPGAQPALEKTFGIEAYGYPSVVAYLPEKGAHTVYAGAFEATEIGRFCASLRRGAKFKPSGEVAAVDAPAWDGEDAPALEEDEFSLEDLMGDD